MFVLRWLKLVLLMGVLVDFRGRGGGLILLFISGQGGDEDAANVDRTINTCIAYQCAGNSKRKASSG